MFAYQTVWSVILPLCKKVMFVNKVHILCMVQMALLVTSTIIVRRGKPLILSKMVLVLEQFPTLRANALQQEL